MLGHASRQLAEEARAVAGAVGAGLSALGLNQWFLRQVDETPSRAVRPCSSSSAAAPIPGGRSRRSPRSAPGCFAPTASE
jgi:hypothetical protein